MNHDAYIEFVEGRIATYNVLEESVLGGQGKEATYEVVFNPNNDDISYQCLLFEFRSIMCKHSLFVLVLERVKQVLFKYILGK